MSLSLKEVLKRLDQQKFALAVWLEIINHLSETVSVGETQAARAVAAVNCSASTVPEEIVKQIIDSIYEKEINPLVQQIESVENLTVEEETTDEHAAEVGEEKGRASGEKQVGKGKQAAQKPQGVRQVVRQSR